MQRAFHNKLQSGLLMIISGLDCRHLLSSSYHLHIATAVDGVSSFCYRSNQCNLITSSLSPTELQKDLFLQEMHAMSDLKPRYLKNTLRALLASTWSTPWMDMMQLLERDINASILIYKTYHH